MSAWRVFRTLLIVLASLGYLANGAQARVHVSQGETLELMLCTAGSMNTRSISIDLPGDPTEETDRPTCGACVAAPGIVPLTAPFEFAQASHAIQMLTPRPSRISPRSPLWPGAPPHGPPTLLKA